MAKLGSGTTMIEVAQTLGYYVNPILLSELVKHPNINKWSACKPIKYNGTMPDSVSQMESVMAQMKYGLEMTGITGDTDARMMSDTIDESKKDCWFYSGVTVSASYPGRLGDFRHYNPDAPCPFQMFFEGYIPGVEGVRGPAFELTFEKVSGAEIDPKNMTHLASGNYYILYRKKGTQIGYSAATMSVNTNQTGLTGSTNVSSALTGDYEACCSIRRGGGDQEFYALPNTYLTFNLRNMTKEEYIGLQLDNRCSMTRSSTVGHLSVAMRVRNITNTAITVTVTCRVSDDRGNYVFQNNGTNFTVPANSYITIYGNENDQLTTTSEGSIRVEGIGTDWQLPFTATCTAKNTLKGDAVITKTVQFEDN